MVATNETKTKTPVIAVAGNPNCGKTTLFNGLTGGKQRIGNWPGVTVEKKEGTLKQSGEELNIVDLPGIYSMAAHSEDEQVARNFILNGNVDLVVNIIDASNLERNLYLTTQLIEMKVPLMLVVNMLDVATKKNITIDMEHLSKHLGIPVIGISAIENKDIQKVKLEIVKALTEKKIPQAHIEYANEIETLISQMKKPLSKFESRFGANARWIAVKLLEGDDFVSHTVLETIPEKMSEFKEGINKTEKILDESMDILIADYKYGFIHGIVKDIVQKRKMKELLTDKIDKVVLNRFAGIPIFLLIMFLLFWFTINVGGAFIDFFDILFGSIFVDGFGALLSGLGSPEWLISILAGGIGAGIQTIATFVPIIFTMFFALSILEDSGYMARAAFVMDRFMRMIGLPGKSFVPMIVGFGCTVPAVMATRTLESKKDRLLTVFMTPFMSCGARLPVYVIFAAAFFPRNAGMLVFSLYMAGIVLAIFTGLILKKTMFKGEPSHFIMELPPYHSPRLRHVMLHTWNRLKLFMLRAGKAIIIIVAVLAFLNSLGTDGTFGNEDSEKSVLASIGKTITPIFQPMGIEKDNWPASVGIFTGIFAKEAVVGTLNSLYSQNQPDEEAVAEGDEGGAEGGFNLMNGIAEAFGTIPENLAGLGGSLLDPFGIGIVRDAGDEKTIQEEFETESNIFVNIRNKFSGGTWQAYAYLLFILLYFPCVAAFAAVLREIKAKLGWILALYITLLAWIVATLFYQITVAHQFIWIIIPLAMFGLMIFGFKLLGAKMKTGYN